MKECKKTTVLRKDRRKERQDDYRASAVYFFAAVGKSCLSFPPSFHSRVVFLGSFTLCLVCVTFSGPSLLEIKFCRTFFP